MKLNVRLDISQNWLTFEGNIMFSNDLGTATKQRRDSFYKGMSESLLRPLGKAYSSLSFPIHLIEMASSVQQQLGDGRAILTSIS